MTNQYIKKTNIWKWQYAPRDKIIRSSLKNKPQSLKTYNAKTIPQKIILIDRLQAKGMFDKR